MSQATQIDPAGLEWSDAQQAVFAAVEDPNGGHLVVEALAGSGKTTTIIEALSHTKESESVLMVAFNKAIATELASRVPDGIEVCTLHSFGFRAIRKAQGSRNLNQYTVSDQLKELLGRRRESFEARKAVADLVSRAKGALVGGFVELDELADNVGIAFPRGFDRDRLIVMAQKLLVAAANDPSGDIDFDDMIWLPHALDLPITRYDWVFVDETQDLNPAQLWLVLRAAGSSGRIVAVGDRHQAIYGFRGADERAIPRMIEKLGARVLPLSISYRCPTAVINEAREYVPAIEAGPDARDGMVHTCDPEYLDRIAVPGDFVISRTNAPLISLCFRWLAAGRRATIRGRDIGKGLSSWIKGTNATTMRELRECIRTWEQAEVKRLTELERPTDNVVDKADCLRALASKCDRVADVHALIERLFTTGDEQGSILLMSTHRAKGLEADRVWLLRDTYLQWEGPEERNLLYVAITRSKSELIYVREPVES